MPNKKLSSLGQKELEKIRGKRKVSLEDIADEKEYAKTLSPIARWIRYSKEMGSEKKRLEYFSTIEGRKELVKRFSKSLSEMPNEWDESKYDYEQQAVKRARNFLEVLIDMFLIG